MKFEIPWTPFKKNNVTGNYEYRLVTPGGYFTFVIESKFYKKIGKVRAHELARQYFEKNRIEK